MKNIPVHWRIVRPVKDKIARAMARSSAAALLSVLSLAAAAVLFARVAEGKSYGILLFVLILMAAASYLLRMRAFKISHFAAFELERVLRLQLADRLARAPLGLAADNGAAALAKVAQDDVAALHAFTADSTPLYARAFVAPLAAFAVLLCFDWRLALAAAGVLAAGMAAMGLVMANGKEEMQNYAAAREQVSRAVVEFVQGMSVVRTFDGGAASFGRYGRALDGYLAYLKGWYKRNGLPARVSMTVLTPLPTLVVLLWCGTYWHFQGTLDFAPWLAALLVGTGMAEALMPYMALFHSVEAAKMSAARIAGLLDAPAAAARGTPQTPQDGTVVFEHVDFSYPGRSGKALDDVCFTAQSGTWTALVGASGSGKSTVAKLIPRFWDADGGSIKIGGADVRDIDPDTLMAQISFVFQDNFLFSGSIADNIRLGIPHAAQSDIENAARAANAHDFIMSLPQGYETQAGERGANLSGGQRQRITIARAILQNRPILILDEATAYTDAQNEALIMDALKRLMQGKTVLMAAHRLSSVMQADNILVFEQGRLKEQGTHAQLIAQNGVYARLWRAHEQSKAWRYGRGTAQTATAPC
ncbi:MAG: ABC transporter ATP-binding protein [Neisseria sp.]|nr:ABC transporter ATP-binding protein [Neisseria sp.]